MTVQTSVQLRKVITSLLDTSNFSSGGEQSLKRKLSKVKKQIINLMFPPSCIACHTVTGAEAAEPLCRICHEKWEFAKSSVRAQFHGAPVIPIEIESTNGMHESFIASLVNYRSATLKSGYAVQKRIIFELKRHSFRLLVGFISRELTALIRETMTENESFSEFIVVSIPRSPVNFIATANDGVRAVAREIASYLGCGYADVFGKRLLSKEQKTLGVKARRENIKNSIYLKKGMSELVRGQKIILIDDVVTTGSTVKEASRILLDVGKARNVYIFSIAQNADILIRDI